MIHDFDEIVDRRNTFSTQWDFIQDRFSRSDIIPFSISDTDFRAPQPIIARLKEVADFGVYGYTRWNHDAYRNTIKEYFLQTYDTIIDADWIVYSPSVMYSVSILIRLLKTTAKPKVLTFQPMYDSFFSVIRENDCTLVASALVKEKGKYTIDFHDFERKAKECSLFLLCSPHNPTGKSFNEQELERIVSICAQHNVAIISDEIHMDVTLSAHRRVPLYKIHGDKHQMYTATSASKVFNVPGLGGSFAIVSNKVTRDLFLKQTKTIDFVNSANLMGMWATIVGYKECASYISELISHIEKNFRALQTFVEIECPLILFDVPDATYLAWMDISRLPCTSNVFLEALENVGHVGFMGGATYGDDRYIRINCGCPRSKLEQGMHGLKLAYDAVVRGLSD